MRKMFEGITDVWAATSKQPLQIYTWSPVEMLSVESRGLSVLLSLVPSEPVSPDQYFNRSITNWIGAAIQTLHLYAVSPFILATNSRSARSPPPVTMSICVTPQWMSSENKYLSILGGGSSWTRHCARRVRYHRYSRYQSWKRTFAKISQSWKRPLLGNGAFSWLKVPY